MGVKDRRQFNQEFKRNAACNLLLPRPSPLYLNSPLPEIERVNKVYHILSLSIVSMSYNKKGPRFPRYSGWAEFIPRHI